MKISTLVALAAATLLAPAGALADTAPRAALQAAKQRHIDSTSVENVLTRLDLTTGETTPRNLTESQPVALRMGEPNVMCAHLVSREGREAMVDDHLAADGDAFRAIRFEIDNQIRLKALMAEGKAVRLG